MTVFDRPLLGFVDLRFLTDLGRLKCGTARCLVEISSEFPDDGGGSDVVRGSGRYSVYSGEMGVTSRT